MELHDEQHTIEFDYRFVFLCLTMMLAFLMLAQLLFSTTKHKIKDLADKSPLDYHNQYFNALIAVLFSFVNYKGLKTINFKGVEIKDNSLVLVHPHLTGADGAFIQMALTNNEREKQIIPHKLHFLGTDSFWKIPVVGGLFKLLYEIVEAIPVPSQKDPKAPKGGVVEIVRNTNKPTALFISGEIQRKGQPPVRIKTGFSHMATAGKELIVLRLGVEGIDGVPNFIRDNLAYLSMLSFFFARNITVEHLKTIKQDRVSSDISPGELKQLAEGIYAEVVNLFEPAAVNRPITYLKAIVDTPPTPQKKQELPCVGGQLTEQTLFRAKQIKP